ncbi:MAG: hypothetical protein ACTSO5_10500 [Candidatus Heimdallarchaeaceae archaeon]
MSDENLKRIKKWLFICVIAMIISIAGIPMGFFAFLISFEYGWIALIVVSGIAFLGFITGAIILAFKIEPGIEYRSNQNGIFWLIVTIISFIAVVSGVFWLRLIGLTIVSLIIVEVIFLAIFLVSLIMVIINRNQLRRKFD